MNKIYIAVLTLFICLNLGYAQSQEEQLILLKKEVQEKVQGRAKMAQVMVDKVFSFS